MLHIIQNLHSQIRNICSQREVTVSVTQEQRDAAFFEALRHNYGKPPNESKFTYFLVKENLLKFTNRQTSPL